MNEIAIQKLYRVQGGSSCQNRSRPFFSCEQGGELKASDKRYIYLGDMLHMSYFALRRLGLRDLKDFNENSKNSNVHIIEIVVPNWYTSLLDKYAIRQFNSRGSKFPKFVDITTPGSSYSITGNWIKLLKACCIYASDIKIEKPEDLYNLVFNQRQYNKREIDYSLVNKLLRKCGIRKEDIKDLNAIWENPLIESEEVYYDRSNI